MTEYQFDGFIYQYPALVDSWYDGDSCFVHMGVEPGLEVHGREVRVYGINAPELHAAGGAASLAYAQQLAPIGSRVTLTVSKREKYGRLLAQITLPNGDDFGTLMVAAGEAVVYLV
jgi:endonuclease YncB( thermonuclease family)